MLGANIGSGQRPFHDAGEWKWLNVDVQERWKPDIVGDAKSVQRAMGTGVFDVVVLHHVLEHCHLSQADEMLRDCHGLLSTGGSLLVFVPDMYELVHGWMNGRIDDYIFAVNTHGAYQGDEADFHRWHYTHKMLTEKIRASANWSKVEPFDWREIPGASIAKDWYILGMEAIK